MKNIIISVILIIAVFVINFFFVKPIEWKKKNKQTYVQSSLTFTNYILSYLLCVNSFIIASQHDGIVLNAFAFTALSSYFFSRSVKQLSPLIRIKVTQENNTPYALIVCMEWFSLFALLSTINYSVYRVFPAFYELPQNLSEAETAFEFVYYTFTLMISYSSDTIVANHIVTKSLQMAEVVFFYVSVGIVISQLLGRVAETVYASSSKKPAHLAKKKGKK